MRSLGNDVACGVVTTIAVLVSTPLSIGQRERQKDEESEGKRAAASTMAWVSVREALRREPVAWAVVAGVVFLHVGFSIAGPYGFFRDELYFIDCGRHPAFGYVDQPPLVPWIAAATQLFGRCLALIRLLPALGHAATIVVTAALAGVVAEAVDDGPTESKRVAQLAAGGAVALAPMYWGLHSVLSTTAFETLAWTFIAYAMARATLRGETRWLVWLGVALGVALEAKYAAPFFVAPLVVGVLLGPSRRVLASRDAMIGLGAAVAIALPSFVWQATHRFPFLELMHALPRGRTRSSRRCRSSATRRW